MSSIFVPNKSSFYVNILCVLFNLAMFFLVGGYVALYVALACVAINGTLAYLTNPFQKVETPVLEYDNRWDDPDYVNMIHETINKEISNGIIPSVCECRRHRQRALPEAQNKTVKAAVLTPQEVREEQKTKGSYVVRYVNGFPFQVPDFVPEGASTSVVENGDGRVVSAYFTWYDVNGKRLGYVASHLTDTVKFYHNNGRFDTRPSFQEDFEKALRDRNERF